MPRRGLSFICDLRITQFKTETGYLRILSDKRKSDNETDDYRFDFQLRLEPRDTTDEAGEAAAAAAGREQRRPLGSEVVLQQRLGRSGDDGGRRHGAPHRHEVRIEHLCRDGHWASK